MVGALALGGVAVAVVLVTAQVSGCQEQAYRAGASEYRVAVKDAIVRDDERIRAALVENSKELTDVVERVNKENKAAREKLAAYQQETETCPTEEEWRGLLSCPSPF